MKKAFFRPTHVAIDFPLLYLNAFPVKNHVCILSATPCENGASFLRLLTPLTFKETIFRAADEILTSKNNKLQI